MQDPPASTHNPAPTLAPWEISSIEIFVRAANLIGLPRSVGEIYGMLFCAQEPLTFDDFATRLGISRGSVSQGLKLLRQLGAIKLQYIAGSRKDYYVPELSMKRLVQGFIRDQFGPHLDSGAGRLNQVEALLQQEADPQLREHATNRLQTLRTWQRRMQKLLPVILAVLGGTQLLRQSSNDGETVI